MAHTPKQQTPQQKLHRFNNVLFYVTLGLGVASIAYLLIRGNSTTTEVIFRAMQFVLMLILLKAPDILRLRYRIEVPAIMSITVIIFAFSALVMGDGLDFYGRIPWWDKLLHAESGILLSIVALWLIHIIMAENEKYIYFNKYFLCLFLVLFSLGIGAFWEILEFSYDSIAGTNSQQFMLSTTSSIILPTDIPKQGHAALEDTMWDLILDFLGALLVAIVGFIRHDDIVAYYQSIIAKQQTEP